MDITFILIYLGEKIKIVQMLVFTGKTGCHFLEYRYKLIFKTLQIDSFNRTN